MNTNIKTLGELKKSGYKPVSVKEEVRRNLIKKLQSKENPFPGIIGYEDTVIPDTERALLSRHNILFLGLRGQAKTRMARQMTELLDEYIPVVEGSEVNDDPFHPLSRYARDLIAEKGDDTPITWLPRTARYGEKLATPDVSVADLIGDIDPIKAANLKLSFADEKVIHFGIIPRSNRGIFVINELPDLQARIQVSLFNILQEGDIQIRGFKVRMPLDILFVFTANPEDYTNRGSIVTPLKDRIESQIITHYPKTIEHSLLITEQEADIHEEQVGKVQVADMVKRLIEQVSFEARNSEYVDKKSGVSARLTIAAFENAVSAGERRAIINKEKETQVRIADLQAIIPAITGKIELVYEGEQEGPLQVAHNLLDKAIRTLFTTYFPNPETFKKKRQSAPSENPYRTVIQWFDQGNSLQMLQDISDKQYETSLNKVTGLKELVKSRFPKANNKESLLLMEFVLHGLAAHSLISKKVVENETRFSDLLGTMMNFSLSNEEDEE
ncbi:magnesium chelatase subunit I [Chitinophaga terrae (ex Kim and Jung 2007)]|uniref:Magnesium chelatase subunit I n=1 Tax=Chitinophaga terrae (ex Kim and Jung 2007) TaxID=408074 RepID=A0A1H4GIV7_9BACT|nr:sigma 54-interacting transcriptional regulator [Chitinophaga terrae (ex Kim and Jung 2007)]GEP93505.1 magnesium chelatase [Chitinophaga terrae (ex Kim and Jung 2007)]SEB09545.1 magnesium chelatase subunit I [Chitinophaga terrae (ex Kim and Jung 2007)]